MEQMATVVGIASWEIILVLFLIGGGFLLGMLLGRSRVFLLLLGSYISYALLSAIPFKNIFPDLFDRDEDFVIFIVIFLALIGLIYFLFSRSIIRSSIRKKGDRSVFHIFFLSLFLIGVILTVVFSYFPEDLLNQFSITILNIFNTPLSRVLWLIVPLLFIGIFRRKKKYER